MPHNEETDQDTDADVELFQMMDANPQLFKLVAGNVAKSYYSAFIRNGRIEDLDKALGLMRRLLADMESGRFDHLNILGSMCRLRFETLREEDDIEQSVASFQEAVSLLPTVDEDRRDACTHMVHTGLATAYSDRFKAFGRIEDLQSAIAEYFAAVSMGPQSDGNFTKSVSGIASSLATRFEHLGAAQDLAAAVGLTRVCIDLLDGMDPQRITLTLTLANALVRSFDQSGTLEELEEAIGLYKAVIAVRAEGHPQLFLAIGNLASAHHSRFERLNEIDDLSSAIHLHEVLLELLPQGRPIRDPILNNLGNALLRRFNEQANESDLKKALECYREALALCGPDNLDRAKALINLGHGLSDSFSATGRFEDLEEGIAQYREAISIVPEGHRHKDVAFQKLAYLLGTKFSYLGQRRDLEEALDLSRQSLEFHPPGDANRPSALAACADIILQRFSSFGIMADVKQAAFYRAEALDYCPERHTERASYLYEFACVNQTLYAHFSDLMSLESAFLNHTLALSLRPPGHASRALSLKGLAEAHSSRFKRFGRIEDLEVAISLEREAISLRPAGHPRRFSYLNDLALDLIIRFDLIKEMRDLEEAITLFTAAKASMAETAPAQSRLDRHLAIAYLNFAHASAEPGEAVQTLRDWAAAARTHGRHVPLQVYSRALALLEQTVVAFTTIDMQHGSLAARGAPRTIALDAAAVAIEEGKLEAAVELLEQGRAMLWARMRGYRSSLDELHDVDATLAEEFKKVTEQLEALAMSVENALDDNKARALDFDRKMKAQRMLQERWDELVHDIRQLDGFEHFLRPVPFKTLRAAADGGPVIMINVSEYRCDALILQQEGSPSVVSLPNLTLDGLRELNTRFLKATQRGNINSRELVVILRRLWKDVMQPIAAALQALGVPRSARVWWCPTSFLCAFPLHAAGMYTKAEPDASVHNLFISSYTPTLSALIQARANIEPSPHGVQMLVVGQPAEDLPNVGAEVGEVASQGAFVNTLVGEAATPLRVLAALQQHSYAHFACHAAQARKPSEGDSILSPFESAFKLHSGGLRLLDVVQARLPRADFAFLSACETATGDVGAPDEAIHLAAAMQFAGFRSVVGTLWEMLDVDGPFIAKRAFVSRGRGEGGFPGCGDGVAWGDAGAEEEGPAEFCAVD
ncbi:CHAT domain-containing protein [Mycena metata]|uniref:CHAT domain-containing protein n=1 Tax=Mycena metata TaxID=1033252 RepID=A0AAD7IJB2_9AGAR|nr:CHAT domain-containing protein [Mycena metata]